MIPKQFLHMSLTNFEGSRLSNWGAVSKVIEDFKQSPFGVCFIGEPGVGKTHLLVGLYKYLVSHYPMGAGGVEFFSWKEVLYEIRVRNQGYMDEVLTYLASVRILLLDDVTTDLNVESFGFRVWESMILACYNASNVLAVTANFYDDVQYKRWLEALHSHLGSRIIAMLTPVLLQGQDWRVESAHK